MNTLELCDPYQGRRCALVGPVAALEGDPLVTPLLADMTTTMRALNAGLSMEGVTMYLFWLSTVAMGAGAI
jgi:hypothetical protein